MSNEVIHWSDDRCIGVLAWQPAAGPLRLVKVYDYDRGEGETDAQIVARMEQRMLDTLQMRATDPKATVAMTAFAAMKRSFPVPGSAPDTEVHPRNCWGLAGQSIVVDVPKLRQDYLRAMRQERDRRLQLSDGEMLRRNETGLLTEQLAYRQYRQQLRDLPAQMQSDLAVFASADDIENYQPPWPVEP